MNCEGYSSVISERFWKILIGEYELDESDEKLFFRFQKI